MPSKPRALSLFAEQITSTGDLSLTGSPVFGDGPEDSVTFNASSILSPNGLNFDSNTPLTLTNGTGTGVLFLNINKDISSSSALTFDGTNALSTSAATFNLFNTGPTTVNFGGAATTLSIGAATGTTTVNNNLYVTNLVGPATLTIDPTAIGDDTGTVVIKGNLQVDGTTTTINSTTLTVDDKNIVVASGAADAAAANGAGITVDGANATFTYVSSGDTFALNKGLKLPLGVSVTEFSDDGSLAGNSDLAVPTEKAVKSYVNDFQAATFEPTGFSRGNNVTMGIMEFSLDGTTVYKIDHTSTSTTRTDGKFATGTAWETAASPRTLVMYPAAGQTSFITWQSGIKYTFTTLQSVSFTAGVQASHFFFFDQGVLGSYSSITGEYIQKLPFVSEVYCDEASNTVIVFGEERHGITMDGATHLYLHGTTGTRYRSGLGIAGITAGATTYTSTVGGTIYDEDISISIGNQNTNNMLYMVGTSWKILPADNKYAYISGGVAQYNKLTGSSYSLEPIPAGSYAVMYFMATNCRIHQTMKVMGQHLFTNLAAARESAQSEPRDTVLLGLPSPEFLYVGAVVVDYLGQVQTLDNNAVFVDLRLVNISAGTNSSSAAVVMTADSAIFNNTGSGLSATNVQLALTELGQEKVDRAGDTMTGPLVINTSSSSNALRITQTGSGNAFVVEDAANPDASPFVIDANGNVGVGTASPSVKIEAFGDIAANSGSNSVTISAIGAIELLRTEGNPFIDFKNALGEDYDCRIQQSSDGLVFNTGGNGTSSTKFTIQNNGNQIIQGPSEVFQSIYRTDAGATNNYIGNISWFGKNSASTYITQARIIVQQKSATAGAETSAVAIQATRNGSSYNYLSLLGDTDVVSISNSGGERVRVDASGNTLIGTTTNTNSSKLVVNGTISETVNGVQYPVVSQADIGTAPNEIPVNSMLGALAFQDTATSVSSNPYIDTALTSTRPSLMLDFVNNKTLDSRISFSRASTATYYDGKTTAKAEENLLNYSQSFDNVWWAKNWSSISYGSGVAPDGTLTASYLREDTSNNTHGISNAGAGMALTANAVYTWSVYAKAGSRNYLALSAYTDSHSVTYFNLATGAIATNPSVNTASITSVGNGWYRCSVTRTVGASGTNGYFSVGAASADNTWSYTGDGVSGIYIWGAQFEQRSGASAYTPTTSSPVTNYIPALRTAGGGAPRFDHDPITGESKGLLIEEQRTNILTQSSGFDTAGWSRLNCTVIPAAAVAPDGTLTAQKFIPTASGNKAVYSATGVPTGTYTWSVYAKAGEMTTAYLATGTAGVFVNLLTGALKYYYSSDTSGYSVTAVGNGWYRISFTATLTATNAIYIGAVDNNDNSLGSATASRTYGGIYIWGAQVEAGAFPTSYIPTTSAQVTRSADSASMTGTNFSNWYRPDEGTLCVDLSYKNAPINNYQYYFAGFGSTIGNLNANLYNGTLYATAWAQSNSGAGVANTNSTNKFAMYYSDSSRNYGHYVNGTNVGTATLGTPGNMLYIGTGASGSYINGYIQRITYYPARLSNAELQEMTQ